MRRLPIPALQPFVALLWASNSPSGEPYGQPVREHVLPGGTMHLVFRLTDCPLRIVDAAGNTEQSLSAAIVGGVRSRFYIREMHAPACSVGAVLRPGAAEALFGVAAEELAERHTQLDDLWPSTARSTHERLLEAGSGEERLAALESELTARLPRVRILHPAIASVMDRMHTLQSIEAAVALSGVSHRNFVVRFRRTVGLAPKTYLRVLRFQGALRSLSQGSRESLAALAAHAGYSDQAHFHREFLAFTGVTPGEYRALSPIQMNHLPVGARRTRHG